MTSRVQAYSILVHHALNELYYQHTCCLRCCAPCAVLKYLDEEGILNEVVKLWETYSDGTPVLKEKDPAWWVNGEVDRDWLYSSWRDCVYHYSYRPKRRVISVELPDQL